MNIYLNSKYPEMFILTLTAIPAKNRQADQKKMVTIVFLRIYSRTKDMISLYEMVSRCLNLPWLLKSSADRAIGSGFGKNSSLLSHYKGRFDV